MELFTIVLIGILIVLLSTNASEFIVGIIYEKPNYSYLLIVVMLGIPLWACVINLKSVNQLHWALGFSCITLIVELMGAKRAQLKFYYNYGYIKNRIRYKLVSWFRLISFIVFIAATVSIWSHNK